MAWTPHAPSHARDGWASHAVGGYSCACAAHCDVRVHACVRATGKIAVAHGRCVACVLRAPQRAVRAAKRSLRRRWQRPSPTWRRGSRTARSQMPRGPFSRSRHVKRSRPQRQLPTAPACLDPATMRRAGRACQAVCPISSRCGRWQGFAAGCARARHLAGHVVLEAPCTMHHAPSTMHHAPCTKHHAPCTMHQAPCTMHDGPPPRREVERNEALA
eukprot:350834-Chlamydomonas_euryale.AAC.8